jgi:hypothetical protein
MTRQTFRIAAGWLPVAVILGCGCTPVTDSRSESTSEQRAEPAADAIWLRPDANGSAEPVWGVKDGLAVGLWPESGPRGLIRIYAPYLGQRRPRMVNFIALEPVVKGVRGQSELEIGRQSKKAGLAMWTGESRETVTEGCERTSPSPGHVEHRDSTELLTFFLATEPFRNGARPIVQVVLRADRPREVGFRVFAAEDSAAMDSCVLTATMGNYGRLRRLWLRSEVVDSRELWPEFKGDALGFAPWRAWQRDRLLKVGEAVLVAATSDETDLTLAAYQPDVPEHWRYEGKPATHYWRTADAPGVVARVNGRATYWGGNTNIPGGVAYENFELEAPFSEGQEFWFGVTREDPEMLGFKPG